MNSRHRTIIKRIMLAITMMLVMLVLCGCRTRLTNNNEVSNVIYDEEGYRYDEYQQRRDELGLSTAKKPIFTGFGSQEDDSDSYDYGGDTQMLEDYEPEESDGYEEAEEPESSQGNASDRKNSSEGGGGRVARRRSSGESRSDTSRNEIVVTLKPNGGTCKVKSVTVKTGGKYGNLPKPERDGYVFRGWFTNDEGGKKVTESTIVGATRNHLLFAQWDGPSKKINDYTITFDLNSPEGATEDPVLSEVTDTKTKEGKYPQLPKASCKGFSFLGWYTSASDERSKVDTGSEAIGTKDSITLFAHWEDVQKYWSKRFDEILPTKDEDKYTYSLGDNDKQHKAFLDEAGMKEDKDGYDYLIFFGNKEDAVKGTTKTIVIPPEAVATSDEKIKLLYKYKLLKKLYPDIDIDISKIEQELGIKAEGEIEILDVSEEPDGDSGESAAGEEGEE